MLFSKLFAKSKKVKKNCIFFRFFYWKPTKKSCNVPSFVCYRPSKLGERVKSTFISLFSIGIFDIKENDSTVLLNAFPNFLEKKIYISAFGFSYCSVDQLKLFYQSSPVCYCKPLKTYQFYFTLASFINLRKKARWFCASKTLIWSIQYIHMTVHMTFPTYSTGCPIILVKNFRRRKRHAWSIFLHAILLQWTTLKWLCCSWIF